MKLRRVEKYQKSLLEIMSPIFLLRIDKGEGEKKN